MWFLKVQSKYEGEFKKDLPNGKGRIVHFDGSIYEGYWKDGKASGKGLFLSSKGDKYFGDFLNDV